MMNLHENFVAKQYKRAADEADDLQEKEQYLKDNGCCPDCEHFYTDCECDDE